MYIEKYDIGLPVITDVNNKPTKAYDESSL